MEIRPQPGPQEKFIGTPADIGIYGGGAGGGKSFGLLMEPLRHVHNPLFGAVIFRRNATDVRNEGGLWDESSELYPLLSAIPNESKLYWTFPSGCRIRFGHLEHEKTKHKQQGSQIAYMGFDEMTHFTESQFWYMTSRMRSKSGITPYVRGSCNPDPDSFVFRLIQWFIGQDGYPIKERSGKLRWFIRSGDDLIWADSREELIKKYGPQVKPQSLTFVASLIHDNKILLEKDPGYLARLEALPRVDRERLLGGNWLIRPASGMYFRREYFPIVDVAPVCESVIRYWDRAATEQTADNPDPDWTVGLKLGRDKNGRYWILDVVRFRGTPAAVEERIKNVASQDGRAVQIGIEVDPGQAGKAEASYYVRQLAGYNVRQYPVTKDKETRSKPASAQAEAGNIGMVRAPWNEPLLTELVNFPKGEHDDQVDTLSGAFNALASGVSRILLA